MGQAFRRAAGRLRNTNIETSSSSAPSRFQNSFEQRPPPVPHEAGVHIYKKDAEGGSKSNVEVGEERDPKFETMLSQMAGTITAKPGGKLEMGEAFVVQKSKRPMPKKRSTTPDSGRYKERSVAAGTLNVAQLRRIMLLHQGKADDHKGPMGLMEIAKGFQVDAAQLETIFQFVSLPSEDNNRQTRHDM